MPKLNFIFAALLVVPCAVAAAPTGPSSSDSMTRLVVRNVSPRIIPGSFASQPRTIYRVGEHYARVEEELDPADGVHDVLIRAQRETWLVDLGHQTIQHALGQSSLVRIAIVDEANIGELELGTEPQFLKKHSARLLEAREDGNDLKEVVLGPYLVHATTKHGTDIPVKLEIGAVDKQPVVVLLYDEYSTLPADPALFVPPAGSFKTSEVTSQ